MWNFQIFSKYSTYFFLILKKKSINQKQFNGRVLLNKIYTVCLLTEFIHKFGQCENYSSYSKLFQDTTAIPFTKRS